MGGGGYFLFVLFLFAFCPFSLSLNLGFVGSVGRRDWGTGGWEGLGAPFVLGGVSNFAFGVKTNFVLGTMFPSLRVLGSWVSVPVPGGKVVLGVVPFTVGTNENRSG